jgi:hypothetical protein
MIWPVMRMPDYGYAEFNVNSDLKMLSREMGTFHSFTLLSDGSTVTTSCSGIFDSATASLPLYCQ